MRLMSRLSRRSFTAAAAAAVFPWPGTGPAAAANGTVHDVEIRKFRFVPARITVRAGDRVRWTNRDIAPHTATDFDGDWDTGPLQRNEDGSIVFSSTGRVEYFCAFHPRMKGEIIVSSG